MFVMSGTAGEADFLKALSQVEERILGKGFVRASAGPRPWNHAVAPMAPVGTTGVLTHSAGTVSGAAAVVPFPSEDESTGVVSMGWRGPKYAPPFPTCVSASLPAAPAPPLTYHPHLTQVRGPAHVGDAAAAVDVPYRIRGQPSHQGLC